MEFTTIILAGGKSSRMGQNKALLPFGGTTVIERLIQKAKLFSPNLIIVANQLECYEHFAVPVVEDLRKNLGPLAGMEAGLTASKTEANLLLACDIPFFDAEVAKELVWYLQEYEVVVPRIFGQCHPLFAAYRKSNLPIISAALDKQEKKIMSCLEGIKVKWLMEEDFPSLDEVTFFNMNRPSDYQEAKRLLEERQ